jgi:hypothetical protein
MNHYNAPKLALLVGLPILWRLTYIGFAGVV